MMGNYYGDMFNSGFGGGLMMILFWVAFIFFMVWIVKEMSGEKYSDRTRHSKSALAILSERYAKGEIDKKEFEEKKQDLSD